MRRLLFVLMIMALFLAVGCGQKTAEVPPEKVVKLTEKPAESVQQPAEPKKELPPAAKPAEKSVETPAAKPAEQGAPEEISSEGIEPAEEPAEKEQVTTLNDESQVDFGEVI